MTKTRNRFLSILLCACMMLSLLPASAGASGTAAKTLYFDNTAGWSTVNIYYWSDSNTAMVDWPGVAMTLVEGTIYTYTVPADAQKVIFNNGSDQTADLTIPESDNLYIYNTGWSAYANACDHDWDTGTITTAATCTAAGVKTYTCSLCGDTTTEIIAATGHTYVNGVCTDCGAEVKVLYFDNTAGWGTVNIYYWSDSNSDMVTWPGVSMTLVDGTIYSYAVPADAQQVIFNNGSDQTQDLTIPESDNLYTYNTGWSGYGTCNHSWDEGTVTTAATCTADGVMTYACANCGETKTEVITAPGHTYVDGNCEHCGAVEE